MNRGPDGRRGGSARQVRRSERPASRRGGRSDLPGSGDPLRESAAALRERVKELTCLYGIARIAALSDAPTEEILTRIASLLPPAWLHTSVAHARILLDGREHRTEGFRPGKQVQSAEIVVGAVRRGSVEVHYEKRRPKADEGPFLQEERNLIDVVAREVAIIIERRQAAEENRKLQQQLLHADRLATIGQLSAGVAHELNEPLNNILGFAQLARGCEGLPGPAGQDIDKIVAATLHAREVIRKLMLFSRQIPSQRSTVDINRIVEDGLYFLESRCSKAGIRVERRLAAGLPQIAADGAQLTQVLVNLVVNAVQAMPEGGVLTIRTAARGDDVLLGVEDTGTGMTPEVREKAFLPFFTTKDVGEGTGLGLAVVHGIVAAHRGSIDLESGVGSGTSIAVRLPVTPPQEPDSERDGIRS